VKREELLSLRQNLEAMVSTKKAEGDYSADSPAIRMALETNLAILDHLLERAKK